MSDKDVKKVRIYLLSESFFSRFFCFVLTGLKEVVDNFQKKLDQKKDSFKKTDSCFNY